LVHEFRAGLQPLTAAATPQLLDFEWVPRQALEPVRRLAGSQAAEAAQLEAALQDESRRQRDLANLIKKPQPWVSNGSGALWATLADLALAYGMLAEGEKALVEAAKRAGVDRVRTLARAAQVARLRGKLKRADGLLAEARELDADH